MKLIFLFVGIVFLSCNNKQVSEPSSNATYLPDKNPVFITILKKSSINRELVSNGKLMAKQKLILAFETNGTLEVLEVKNGDKVTKGQVIARLKQDRLKQALQQTSINMQKAQLEFQDIIIGQGFNSSDSASITPEIYKVAEIRSGYSSAKIEYQKALLNLEASELKAPFAGVIANLNYKSYERVSPGKVFCTLIDISGFDVEFSILETEISDISLNKALHISPFYETNSSYTGIITEINPSIDQFGLIKVKASIRETGNLIDGANVKVFVETEIPNQLIVPRSAVVLRQNQEVLFKYINSEAFWVYVKVLEENSTSYAVIPHPEKGGTLNEGDTVIISGNLNLAHESIVEIK